MANGRQKPRRLFQFSLLSAIVCLTLACIVLGILVRRVERQRKAVASILKSGGRVSYEHSIARGSRVHWDNSVTPSWLRQQLGEDWFSTVHGVTLYGDGCNDATLQHVKELPDVRRIALWVWVTAPPEDNPRGGKFTEGKPLAGITDNGLLVFKTLTNLEHISFMGNRISDNGLKHLHSHPTLRSLQLSPDESNCTKKGIEDLVKSLGAGAGTH